MGTGPLCAHLTLYHTALLTASTVLCAVTWSLGQQQADLVQHVGARPLTPLNVPCLRYSQLMLCCVQLHEALDSSTSAPNARTFCNTWVRGLSVQLPPLAVAIDDSLMALIERCMHQLAPANSPLQPNQATHPETSGGGPQTSMFPASPDAGQRSGWMSSASSPMTLLEQARQAQRLNQALDGITSPNRQPGRTDRINNGIYICFPIISGSGMCDASQLPPDRLVLSITSMVVQLELLDIRW